MKAIDAVVFHPIGITVDGSGQPYPDAVPALAELEALGVKVIPLPTLSVDALRTAVAGASLSADRVICLTDSEHGVLAAREAGVQPVLMMNDPDEAMRLTSLNPTGGIVSLHELPDFVRLLLARRP